MPYNMPYKMERQICSSGWAITEESRYIPLPATECYAFSLAASTAATAPVNIRWDFPHLP